MPPRLDPPPQGAITTSGACLAGQRQLLLRLQPDHGLVQQHVVEHRAERVVRVVAAAQSRTASEMAEPSEPGCVGSSTGDGTTSPPQVSIAMRR